MSAAVVFDCILAALLPTLAALAAEEVGFSRGLVTVGDTTGKVVFISKVQGAAEAAVEEAGADAALLQQLSEAGGAPASG